MKIFYWITGILVSLFLLRMAFSLALRFAARYFLKKYVGDKAISKQPDHIRLIKDENRVWQNAEAMESNTKKLLARGFTDLGVFRIENLPDVKIRMFAKSDECICSCIYEHPKVGLWMDCFTRYQDGTGITFSTSKNPGLDQMPGRPIFYYPELTADELYLQALSERPKESAMLRITPGQLTDYFEKAYAESMVWRKNKGISGKEVANVAAARDLFKK